MRPRAQHNQPTRAPPPAARFFFCPGSSQRAWPQAKQTRDRKARRHTAQRPQYAPSIPAAASRTSRRSILSKIVLAFVLPRSWRLGPAKLILIYRQSCASAILANQKHFYADWERKLPVSGLDKAALPRKQMAFEKSEKDSRRLCRAIKAMSVLLYSQPGACSDALQGPSEPDLRTGDPAQNITSMPGSRASPRCDEGEAEAAGAVLGSLGLSLPRSWQ